MAYQSLYLVSEFKAVEPGEPYRLFPFGTIYKDGRSREITPEFAQKLRLPHFKPPIKLGSHRDETPGGGRIIGLKVVGDGSNPDIDGIYAIPELNPNGTTAFTERHYGYNSPEIIWGEDQFLENPTTGEPIYGPLIVGDALLHTPHLGEATALYGVTPLGGEPKPPKAPISNGGNKPMSENTVQVPTSFFDRMIDLFTSREEKPQPEPQPAPVPQPEPDTSKADEYAAAAKAAQEQVEQYKAELENMKAAQARAGLVSHYAAELQETAVKDDTDLHTLLSGMDKERAGELVRRFKALSAQIKESNLTGNLGGNENEPVDEYASRSAEANALVMKRVADSEGKLDYNAALNIVRAERPELFQVDYHRTQRGGA